MINVHIGNLLSVEKGIIVQQVNCRGAMGSGVAAAIMEKYPIVAESYFESSKKGFVGKDVLGMVQFIQVSDTLWVANLYGQLNYGGDPGVLYTNYDAVREGMKKVSTFAETNKEAIHFPLLGSGLAGGDWRKIATIINETLNIDLSKNLWVRKIDAAKHEKWINFTKELV